MRGRYPRPLEQRFPQGMGDLQQRVTALEQIVGVLDPGCYVVCYTGQVPASYVSGDPTVKLTGTSIVLGPLKTLDWYTPHANDQVLLIPAGQSYIVAGTYS